MKTKAQRRIDYRNWALKRRDHLLAKEKHRQITKRAQCLVSYARKRAHDHGHVFDLDDHVQHLQSRIDKGVCELSGLPFVLNSGRRWDSPSIDRIDPKKGYVLSNVRIILHGLNAALGNWGETVLFKMVTAVKKKQAFLE